jgi:hypothetical protein
VLPVPVGPGLGVHLDPAAVRRLHERFRSEGSMAADDGGYRAAFRQQ